MGAVRRNELLREAPLIVDQTGVGQAVVDMLRQSACGVIPVTITGGHATTVTADEAPEVIQTPPRQGLMERMVPGRSLVQQRGLYGAGSHNRSNFL